MKKLLFLLCVSALVLTGCSKDGDGSKGRSIVFVEESASLFRNETQNLLLNFSDGEAVDSKDLKWKSSNPSIVSVTQNGQITAGSKLLRHLIQTKIRPLVQLKLPLMFMYAGITPKHTQATLMRYIGKTMRK